MKHFTDALYLKVMVLNHRERSWPPDDLVEVLNKWGVNRFLERNTTLGFSRGVLALFNMYIALRLIRIDLIYHLVSEQWPCYAYGLFALSSPLPSLRTPWRLWYVCGISHSEYIDHSSEYTQNDIHALVNEDLIDNYSVIEQLSNISRITHVNGGSSTVIIKTWIPFFVRALIKPMNLH